MFTWSIRPYTVVSRMQETRRDSTSDGSIFNSPLIKLILILVYGWMSLINTYKDLRLHRDDIIILETFWGNLSIIHKMCVYLCSYITQKIFDMFSYKWIVHNCLPVLFQYLFKFIYIIILKINWDISLVSTILR